jgi:hypothetical protein
MDERTLQLTSGADSITRLLLAIAGYWSARRQPFSLAAE